MDVLPLHHRISFRRLRRTGVSIAICLLGVAIPLPSSAQLTDPAPAETAADSETGPEPGEAASEPDSGGQPYIVFVAEREGHARCGPGEQHYRTEALRLGQELEVYMETEDGWLGIRPLENSFCWLPAEVVDINDDGLSATVIEDKTVAWIGTNLGQARRYQWQIQLAAGEQITILGQMQRESSDGAKQWLRIAPPSGEFRWVHRDQIVESAEQLAAFIADEQNAPSQPLAAASSSPARRDAKDGVPVPIPAAEIEQTAAIKSSTESPEGKSVLVASATPNTDPEGLRSTGEIPTLQPAPMSAKQSSRRTAKHRNGSPRDTPIEIHRNVNPNNFKDRGAVIGSGLRADWNETAGEAKRLDELSETPEVDSLEPTSTGGAVAAAAAITEPLRRVSDVVANFISPPRLVEIDPNQTQNFGPLTASDRRWMVGSDRGADASSSDPAPSLASPPASLAGTAQNTSSGLGMPVVQAGATSTQPHPPRQAPRVVPVARIARVEDAVVGADVDAVSHILSKLMAEQASADEMDPLIRRMETLLRSGDVSRASRTRELLRRAESYRNLAARRDGTTIIRSSVTQAGGETPVSPLRRPETPTQPESPTQSDSPTQQPVSEPSSSVTGPPASSAALPVSGITQAAAAGSASAVSQTINTPLAPPVGTATGYLVQVYSSRANSPPYALTDDRGLTIAYVTPYPGVNLRHHLNNRIEVSGREKLLEGMSTPHLLVDQAARR